MTVSIAHRVALTSALALSPLLSGCDWLGGAMGKDTQMKNVEILPGTASDEMVTLDQASGDGTAIDTSAATGPDAAKAADTAAGDEAPAPPEGDAAAQGGENPDAATPTASPATRAASPATRAAAPRPATTRPGDVIIRPPGGRAEAPKTGEATKR